MGPPNLSGQVFGGRYELLDPVGEGGFARVYRARDRQLNRLVAIKVLHWRPDSERTDHARQEAELVARVNHENVVQVYDVGEADAAPFFASELVEGESLLELLKRGSLDLDRALEIAADVARALGAAHAADVIHRDIKPANILLSEDGKAKVTDFGIARLRQATTTTLGADVAGTVAYTSPEQAAGKSAVPASDLYSLGVVLYEMLAGRLPFEAETPIAVIRKHIDEAPPPVGAEPPLPAETQAVLGCALAKDPRERFRGAREMERALVAAREGRSTTGYLPAASAEKTTRALPPATRRRPPRWAVVAVVLLLLLGVGGAAAVALDPFGAAGADGRSSAAGEPSSTPPKVEVPSLVGRRSSFAKRRLRRLSLTPVVDVRYSKRRRGIVLTQRPLPGSRIREDSTVVIAVSLGPRPVSVPNVEGSSVATARAKLERAGFGVTTNPVPHPDSPPGWVVRQSPGGGAKVRRGSTVELEVAQEPSWRTVASMSGTGDKSTSTFHIRGKRWRIRYSMRFTSKCSYGACIGGTSFEVNDQTGLVHYFDASSDISDVTDVPLGPGTYNVDARPSATEPVEWSMTVEEYY